ncbi:hypothetical protein KVR01_011385 [Diaporthe batatas]|uniref:uncharacterized protein n=1 Tax=Diaporthe batatas TaxID=748121 RepID=UPI001D046065|nr:uncharacterized protein KVR01_011385 [Diaporthe batatas]KAG8158942.1 hypothetical protein KVR01_011385 [Diaporthe batatas]
MTQQPFTEAPNLRPELFTFSSPIDQRVAYVIVAFLFLLAVYSTGQRKANVPELNAPKSRLRLFGSVPAEQTQSFVRHSKEFIKAGRAKFPDEPYRLYTGSYIGATDAVIIPPRLINDIRNEQALSFRDFHAHVQGFEGLIGDENLSQLVNRHLTKALNKMTKALSDEAKLALSKKFGEPTSEWLEFKPSSDMLQIVAQVSTRIFMGEELCRNEDWLNESALYTRCAFNAVEVLRDWPSILRPWVAPFLAECKEMRARMARCQEILEPYVTARRAAKAKALAEGEKPPVFNDSLEWFEKEYKHYDAATALITLSIVAIHTTSDLMSEIMIQLARHPEMFQPLRKEIVEVLSRDGLKKTALYNLKLMDSVIKECQRLKPVTLTTMRRKTVKPLKLSNGLVIPKGEHVWVDVAHMWSEEHYENPEEFNPYRFKDLRGTDKEHTAHFVTTSAEHIGFGHGEHACPGRFFASNELKIILCHMLLKYEWKLPEGHDPKYIPFGMALVPDPEGKLLFRRRQEEIDLGSLES